MKTARENEQIQKKKKYSCHFKMSLNFKIPIYHHLTIQGFPWGSAGKKICLHWGTPGFNLRVGKIF